jgi:hypothetical protein
MLGKVIIKYMSDIQHYLYFNQVMLDFRVRLHGWTAAVGEVSLRRRQSPFMVYALS